MPPYYLRTEPCSDSSSKALARSARLTKPPGSLGRLEELAAWDAAIRACAAPPESLPGAVCLFAADHGVATEGVSAYPQSVTASMVRNIAAGGAAISVLARHSQLPVFLVDVGVAADLSALEPSEGVRILHRKVAHGTANLRRCSAMTTGQCEAAVEAGAETARAALAEGASVVVLGEMGIGNTTPAAALVCAMASLDPGQVVGVGTGIDEARLEMKRTVVSEALLRSGAGPGDPMGALAEVGGFELAAMVGAMFECASCRVPVVLDGFLANAAALVAKAIDPRIVGFLLASHRSAERGAGVALEALGLRPLFDLDLRLGEGTGAVLGFALLRSALALQREMATFESAGVDGPA